VALAWGREVCGRLAVAETREWLCTNGIGGFASGTVAGILSRRYHGLLVAALTPPLGRTLLVTKLDETIGYDTIRRSLFANRWAGGTVDPHGYVDVESFRLDGTTRARTRWSRSASGWSRARTRRTSSTGCSVGRDGPSWS
jgi:glycogen debranching enzyme